MRIIFAGTPDFAARALEKLIEAGHDIALVLSQPDRPAGRGRKLHTSAVKELALAHGIPVMTPRTLRIEKGEEETKAALKAMKEARADLLVVAAYGLILPQSVLDIPKGILPHLGLNLKALNIHGSLLPAWRGAAPAARSIEAGDTKTGITLMQMDAGLDTGPMLYAKEIPVSDETKASELSDALSRLGAQMLVEYLEDPEKYLPRPQPEGATYAAKLTKAEGRIDWEQSASVLLRRIHAFDPFPGCFTFFKGEPLKIWDAKKEAGVPGKKPGEIISVSSEGVCVAAGEGSLLIIELQKSGGKRLKVREFLSGYSIKAGEVFGSQEALPL